MAKKAMKAESKKVVVKAEAKKTTKKADDPFVLKEPGDDHERDPQVHVYGPGAVCDTEKRGHATPRGKGPLEIVVDASEGFIPLWAKGMTLRWRFQERSMTAFANPLAAKTAIRALFGEALLAWGNAAPVKFAERKDNWDFEIVMKRYDDCDQSGCVLASAFFPDAGRHKLVLYPKLFTLTKAERVETLVHEIGHIFGLRHFFAQISEKEWASEIYGEHEPFSIMNYGSESVLTEADRTDLRKLYVAAWGGILTEINGTEIRFVRPFSKSGVH
jgi:hypothetical protein